MYREKSFKPKAVEVNRGTCLKLWLLGIAASEDGVGLYRPDSKGPGMVILTVH